MINTLMLALLAAILTNNIVLSRHLGLKSFFETSEKGRTKPVLITSIYLTVILFITTLIFHPIYYILIEGANMTYLTTLLAGLVMLNVGCLTVKLLPKVLKEDLQIKEDQKVFIIVNSLLLGFMILSTNGSANYLLALTNSVGAGLGFGLIGVVFTLIRYRLEISPVPKGFKGIPIGLITAGLIAMAFLGLAGLV